MPTCAERLPWWPGLRWRRRGCARCGADHDSAQLDLTRPSWCSKECYLADDREHANRCDPEAPFT